jgi:hypothetical protein
MQVNIIIDIAKALTDLGFEESNDDIIRDLANILIDLDLLDGGC